MPRKKEANPTTRRPRRRNFASMLRTVVLSPKPSPITRETIEAFLARGGQIQYPPVGQLGTDPELDRVEV